MKHAQKNRMGSAVTDSQGRFQIEIPKKQLEEVVQGPPVLYFRIYQAGEMVANTEDLVLWNVSRGESELRIEVDTLSFDLDELALERCAPGVRSLLQQSEQVIRQIGICSGGAPELLYEAIDEGYDAYLTGEATEWVKSVAEESGVAFISAGHHATERFGARRIAEALCRDTELHAEFIDVDVGELCDVGAVQDRLCNIV